MLVNLILKIELGSDEFVRDYENILNLKRISISYERLTRKYILVLKRNLNRDLEVE